MNNFETHFSSVVESLPIDQIIIILQSETAEALVTVFLGSMAAYNFSTIGNHYNKASELRAQNNAASAKTQEIEAAWKLLRSNLYFWIISSYGAMKHGGDWSYFLPNIEYFVIALSGVMKERFQNPVLSEYITTRNMIISSLGIGIFSAQSGNIPDIDSFLVQAGMLAGAVALTIENTKKKLASLTIATGITSLGATLDFFQSEVTKWMAAFWALEPAYSCQNFARSWWKARKSDE